MKKQLRHAAYSLLWLFTACIGLLDLICAGRWWYLSRYVERYGAVENPYAAEDAFMAGMFTVFLLIPFLCLLAVALWGRRRKKLVKPSDENETAGN